jgi:DNA invertase Pin-like site-specific DNA recombinase
MSRLGRSVGHIAILVDELQNNGVRLIFIEENMELNGRQNMQSKVMVTIFSLFAEIERDLISERTKEGLARVRAEDKLLGRPKGRSVDQSFTARKAKSGNTSHEV